MEIYQLNSVKVIIFNSKKDLKCGYNIRTANILKLILVF